MTADLQRARDDLRTFSRLIDSGLAAWQAESLQLRRRTTVIVAPRQSGKSRSLSVLALHRSYRQPNHRTLIISAGEDAARRLLATASALAVRSPWLKGSVVDENAGLIVLSNGSEIRSVPQSERQVRGWTVDLLLIDECALVSDDLLLAAAFPTTSARPDARIVLASSPAGPEGAFFEFARAGESGSEHVATFRWDLTAADWIAAEVVAAAREQLAPAQFAREFAAEFADVGADERVVDTEWLRAAQSRQLEGDSDVVFGLDVARRGGDESVLVSVQGGVARVVWAVRGLDLMALSGKVVASVGSSAVWIDAIGLGYGVVDRLQELGVRAVPFVASASSSHPGRYRNLRSEAWWHVREAFREGLVDLDESDRVLSGQLGAVRYRLASNGAIQIQAKDEMRVSPDRADALVIGLWGARGSTGTAWVREALRDQARRNAADPLLRGETPVPLGLWRGAGAGITTLSSQPADPEELARLAADLDVVADRRGGWMGREW